LPLPHTSKVDLRGFPSSQAIAMQILFFENPGLRPPFLPLSASARGIG
jgi:hypothetical protein